MLYIGKRTVSLPTAVLNSFSSQFMRLLSSSTSVPPTSLVGKTLVGQSGRKYLRTQRLSFDTTKYQRSVYIATCEGQSFVLKRVSEHAYKKCQQLKVDFAGSPRLRIHEDELEEERTLIYTSFTGNLLHFVRTHGTQLSNETLMRIMWEIGMAIKEMHDKNIFHVDLKPDNILLNWKEHQSHLPNSDGTAQSPYPPPEVGKIIVSDLDSCLEMKGWSSRPTQEFQHVRFGNIRWRAPEMQTGLGIGLFSDVFACALIYVYVLTSQVVLGEDDYDALGKQEGMLPEELVLGRTMEYFGPLTPGFLKHTKSEHWEQVLEVLQQMVTEISSDSPSERLENWTLEDFPRLTPSLMELLSKMLKFDPAERINMNQVMDHPVWTTTH